MMICNKCGELFKLEDGEDRYELVGEFWGAPAYDRYKVCPVCGSDEFDEAVRCSICDELYDGEDDYCEDCKSFLEASLTGYIGSLQLSLNLGYEEALKAVKYEIDRRIG